jgi:hypothetical protein
MMTFARALPFGNQHVSGFLTGENASPISCAYCNEINWRLDPNASKTAQMFVHKQESRCRCGMGKRAAANGSGYSQDRGG